MLKETLRLFTMTLLISLAALWLPPSPLHAESTAKAGQRPRLQGEWAINANDYKGRLEFASGSSGLTGRVWFDAHQAWEDLTNITFEPDTGMVLFTRPAAGQNYMGYLTGKEIAGIFEQGGIGRYKWQARLTSAPAAPPAAKGGQSPSPAGKAEADTAKTRSVTINGKIWMAQNMAVDAGSGSYCLADTAANCEKLGRLYTMEAAERICPAGWRLPVKEELEALVKHAGASPRTSFENLVEGGSSGFNALYGGWRDKTGRYYGVLESTANAAFWSGTKNSDGKAWYLDISRSDKAAGVFVNINAGSAFSVRCLRD